MATLATATEKKAQMNADEKPERKPQRAGSTISSRSFAARPTKRCAMRSACFSGLTRGQALVTRFADGEAYVQIQENVRGADVFVVQPTCHPVDEHLMELLLMIDALKRASARRITSVIPYFGYARQDRKDKPRVPISAKLVADLLTTAGADRALIVDLHAPQLQGFFNIPVDHLFASPVLVDHFKRLNLPNLTVVSPDAGGVERARFFAKKMDSALAIVDKRRVGNECGRGNERYRRRERPDLPGHRRLDRHRGHTGKNGRALMENGASQVYACASHPVLSGPAVREHFAIVYHRSSGDKYHPAERSRQAGTKNQSAYDRWIDRTRNPVDSRRDIGQQIVLIGTKLWQPQLKATY